MSRMWMDVSQSEMVNTSAGPAAPRLPAMSSTWLTKRRAVDHCHVRSSLCRMS
jgi:hypothetical protein